MTYSGRNNIYSAVISRMVSEALAQREREFARIHEADSDEKLLEYLRFSAAELGHTPHPKEIDGGRFVEERFASWQSALEKANLPPTFTPNKPSSFSRYKEERARQEKVYREKKNAKKQ